MNMAEKTGGGNSKKKGALALAFVVGVGAGFGGAKLLRLQTRDTNDICCVGQSCDCHAPPCGEGETDQGDCPAP